MECKLLYLYDDLMNLYGENGNIRVLTRHLQDQGFSVTVDRRSLSDSLDFSGYALIYLGSGTESARNAALRHLVPYRDALQKAEQAGTILLFTGNAWEMLGASVTTGSGETIPGLGLFAFTVTESSEKRITGDVIADLTEDLAAEQKARLTYDNILRLSDDPDVNNVIRFLREREIVHFQRFGECLRMCKEKMNAKNVYLTNPAFDKIQPRDQGRG